jgi:hypothetical protein
VLWSGLEVHLVKFRLNEQSVVRTEPRSILRVGMRIVGKATDTLVPSNGGQVPSFGMDDIIDLLVLRCQLASPKSGDPSSYVGKLDPRNH